MAENQYCHENGTPLKKWEIAFIKFIGRWAEEKELSWGALDNEMERLAKERLKEKNSPHMIEKWSELWLSASYRISNKEGFQDYEQWKSATIKWHRLLYEKGVYDVEIKLREDKEIPKNVKNFFESTTSLGKYWDWEKEDIPEDLAGQVRGRWSSTYFTKDLVFRIPKETSEKEVWDRAMYYEEDGFLPWQIFAQDAIGKKSNSSVGNATSFWRKEILQFPLKKHKNGGLRTPWFNSDFLKGMGAAEKIDFRTAWFKSRKENRFSPVILSEVMNFELFVSTEQVKNSALALLDEVFSHVEAFDLKEAQWSPIRHQPQWEIRKWTKANLDIWIQWSLKKEGLIESMDVSWFLDCFGRIYGYPDLMESKEGPSFASRWFKEHLVDFENEESERFRGLLKMGFLDDTLRLPMMRDSFFESLGGQTKEWFDWLSKVDLLPKEDMHLLEALVLKEQFHKEPIKNSRRAL
jgi:hypothetical protein